MVPGTQNSHGSEDAIVPLARFAGTLAFSSIPPFVIEKIKQHILDTLGAALAGIEAEGISEVVRMAKHWGGRPEASVIGDGAKLPVPLAALANATIARALEIEDVHEKALLHPTVSVVPVALALAEGQGGISGAEFLAAVVAAEEVTCRLGLAPEYHVAGEKHKPRKWSYTYQCGTMGGALAAGRLLGLDQDQLLNAVGIAYTALAGNQQAIHEGVLAIRVQQGLCAETSAKAAYFARAGITGPRNVLEGSAGWFNAWQGGAYDRSVLLNDLGERWETANISIKPYPTCKVTHASISAILQAMDEGRLNAEDVESVTVHVNSKESWGVVVHPVEQRRAPRSPVDAQFCLPFLCAAALVKGKVGLQELSAQSIEDREILAMAQRVHPVIDEDQDVSQGRIMPMPATVDIKTKSGRVVTRRCEYPRGHPRNPMSWEELEAKMSDCTEPVRHKYDQGRLAEVVSMVKELDRVPDVGDLAKLLC